MKNVASGRGLAGPLFAPRRVALVGVSDDPGKASSRPLAYLRASGYDGTVYPVNARRETVAGERAYPRLLDLPEAPDHVFVMTPPDAAIETIRQCAELRVPLATVLAGGFADSGPAGQARQRELARVAADGGVRLLGPSSIGLVNLRNGLRLTGNAVFGDAGFPVGGTVVASQSGSMIGALVSRGAAKGVGFATVISVGGEADLSVGEVCAATLDDPDVTGYLLFLEAIRHPDRLAAFAREAAARGRPVVAYKLGRSAAAAELAVSHSGALVGEDDVAAELLAALGIARVDTLDGLLDAPAMLHRLPLPTAPDANAAAGASRSRRRPAVGLVTTTGGGAAMVVDQLGVRGVEVARPSEQTYQRLAAAGVDVAAGRIVDLTLTGTRYETMRAALEVLASAPEFDVLIVAVGSSARLRPDLAVLPIIDVVRGTVPSALASPPTPAAAPAGPVGGGPVIGAFLVPDAPQAAALLATAGVPVFTTPEACGDVLAAAFARRPPRADHRPYSPDPGRPGVLLDEAAAYRLLRDVGFPVVDHVVLGLADLAAAGVPALPFDYPVAVKALDAALPHKTDAGGVVLDVRGPARLQDAARRVADNVAASGVRLERVLVTPMTRGLGELLVGYRLDAQVGPVVVLAAGGTLTELYRDRAVRLAPADDVAARAMLREVVAVRALEGYRGAPAGDLDAVAGAIVALSRLADQPRVVEAEVNPLVVAPDGQGALGLDALVRVLPGRTS